MEFPYALKCLVAPREMAELARWRKAHATHLAAFCDWPFVGMVLRNLKAFAEGQETLPLWEIKDFMENQDSVDGPGGE